MSHTRGIASSVASASPPRPHVSASSLLSASSPLTLAWDTRPHDDYTSGSSRDLLGRVEPVIAPQASCGSSKVLHDAANSALVPARRGRLGELFSAFQRAGPDTVAAERDPPVGSRYRRLEVAPRSAHEPQRWISVVIGGRDAWW